MFRLQSLVGLAILGLALVVNTGTSQDKKDPGKTKGQLPQGWKDLSLSAEQKQDAYKVIAKYRAKMKALDDQIKALKAEEKQELVKLLTDEQKDKLRKSLTGEDAAKDKKAAPDDAKKDKEKK